MMIIIIIITIIINYINLIHWLTSSEFNLTHRLIK